MQALPLEALLLDADDLRKGRQPTNWHRRLKTDD
jgi:hypothetical protein